jgi:hypothetical protein
LNEPYDQIDCCSDACIIFCYDKYKIKVASDTIKYNISGLEYLLTKALNKKLKLHKSITKDIGYLYNQNLRAVYTKKTKTHSELTYKKVENIDVWAGEDYQLFCYDPATWLYNDNGDNIILEMTPVYPWHFYELDDAQQQKNYIPYEEWIKNYKPLLIRTIPKDVVEQWLHQAQEILKKIEENIARLHKQETIEDAT